jgi:glycosyltransferase involved in cell wall biosynthesis
MSEHESRPMRIALVDPSLFTLPYDLALAAGLRAGGHEATLYGRRPRPADGGTEEPGLVASFYPIAESRLAAALPAPLRLGVKGVDHLLSMARLRRILQARAHRPDVIHFQWLPLPLVDRALLAGFHQLAPLVLTVHDTNPFNGNPSNRLQRLGVAESLHAFDTLVVHTGQGRARLEARGVAPRRIAVLPHGPLAPPVTAPPDPMQGQLTFLCFGQMKPYKGLDLAVEAFALLPETLRARARLRVVGQARMDVAPVEALAATRGVAGQVVIETRFVAEEELPALFGRGVVALFPYREIEASGVLSLALAHGRPVIASRLGTFAETLTDGRDALLVPPGDMAALAGAMARMIDDRGFAAGCAASMQALALAQPDWVEIGQRTAALYEALLPSRAKRVA